MIQEEKDLLLKDLCARLPYGVMIQTDSTPRKMIAMDLWNINALTKPYLRPMLSMTEEEMEELKKEHLKEEKLFIECINKSRAGDNSMRGKVITHFAADWCHKNHFDYRGLIPKGLAIGVTEENNPYINKTK